MKITKTKDYIDINGVDENGGFRIRILKDCSQLQIENENDYSYVNIDFSELKTIRNVITGVLDKFVKDAK